MVDPDDNTKIKPSSPTHKRAGFSLMELLRLARKILAKEKSTKCVLILSKKTSATNLLLSCNLTKISH